jgi:hypothetical protein
MKKISFALAVILVALPVVAQFSPTNVQLQSGTSGSAGASANTSTTALLCDPVLTQCTFNWQIVSGVGISVGATTLSFVSANLINQTTNVLAQTRLTNAQTFKIFNTTDSNVSPTNYEALSLDWQAVANVATLGPVKGGTGTQRFLKVINLGREIVSTATPTSTIPAGFCTTPSVALDTGSADAAGILNITTGSACAAATGSVTLTFSTSPDGAYGTNNPSCVFTPMDSAGAWDTGVTWKLTAASNTAVTVALKNGATNFTSSVLYKLAYICTGK